MKLNKKSILLGAILISLISAPVLTVQVIMDGGGGGGKASQKAVEKSKSKKKDSDKKNSKEKSKSKKKETKQKKKEKEKKKESKKNKDKQNKNKEEEKTKSKSTIEEPGGEKKEATTSNSGGESNSESSSDNKGDTGESKNKKEKKPVKTTADYKGGTEQGVNKDPVKREYVNDPRRNPTDPIRFLSDDEATKSLMNEITDKVNAAIGNKNLLVYSTDGMFSFSTNIYRTMEEDDRKKIMSYTFKTMKESDLPNRVKAKATNFIKEQDPQIAILIESLNSDTSSELAEGYTWFMPFTNPISKFFGVIAMLIMIFIITRFTVDFAYLGPARQLFEFGEGRPKFVSREAWETAKEVDNQVYAGVYKDYTPVYFAKVIPITIFSIVLITWLVSGQIFSVFSFFMEIIENFKNQVFG